MSSPYLFHRDLFKKRARIVRGEGVYIYDEYGKKYLDATGGCILPQQPRSIAK
jgi:adenosylmethionine-8-amino-7-oxononanoate aminotransferase